MFALPDSTPTNGPAVRRTAEAGGALGARALKLRAERARGTADGDVGPVLLVEPDASLRSLLKSALVRAGFEVVACRTAWAARRELEPSRPVPALVVAEISLSPADGFRLCEQLRGEQRTAHVPVLLLGRAPTTEQVALAREVGANELLPKPVYVDDVVSLARLETGHLTPEGVRLGHTSALAPARLLRALLAGRRAGILELDGDQGQLAFQEGRVVEARAGGLEGAAALRELLCFAEGSYRVRFGPPTATPAVSLGLRTLSEDLLPEALRISAQASGSTRPSARLTPDPRRLRDQQDALPLEARELVRRCDGQRTVREVIASGVLRPELALAAMHRLVRLGVLVELPVPRRVLAEAQRASHPTLTDAVCSLVASVPPPESLSRVILLHAARQPRA